MNEATDRSTREKLIDEFAAVLSEAEEMLKKAATETGEKARDLRSQVESKLLHAKLRLQEMQGDGGRQRQGRGARDRRLRARQSLAGGGRRRRDRLLVGLVVSRR